VVSVPSGSPAVSAPVLLSSDALIDTAGSLAVSSAISGSYMLTKLGDGQLILSGMDSYTGGTTVDAGKLILASDHALPNGSDLTVGANASMLFGDVPQAAPVAGDVQAVPEPSTLVLLSVALCGAAVYRRVRARPKKP
jgi:autotransporter-associated beta strand protein